MIRFWKSAVSVAVCTAGWAIQAAGQASPVPEPVVQPASAPMLTLSSPVLRSTMDRINMPWLFPEKLPDFRLKMDRSPMEGPLSPADLQGRLRGLEIQLPMSGLWVGYERSETGEEPRATFSIQRGF